MYELLEKNIQNSTDLLQIKTANGTDTTNDRVQEIVESNEGSDDVDYTSFLKIRLENGSPLKPMKSDGILL